MEPFMCRKTVLPLALSLVLSPVFVFCQEFSPETQKAMHDSVQRAFETVRSGDVSRLEELEKMLLDPWLNTAARTALENLPDRAGIPTLRKGLGSPHEECVAGAISSLGMMEDAGSLSRLADFASCKCHSVRIRTAALRALGRIGDPEGLSVLQNALGEDDPAIQRAAADGICTAAGKLARSGSQADAKTAAEYFRSVRNAKIDCPTTRIALQHELLLTGDASLFQSLLLSPDDADLLTAQIVLTQIGSTQMNSTQTDPDALFRTVFQTLTSLPAERQEKLLATLAVSERKSLTPSLLALRGNASVPQVPLLAALGRLKDIRALDTLICALGSDDETLRETALEGICRLEPEEIQDAVGKLLQNGTARKIEQLAALEIVRNLWLKALLPQVKLLMTDSPDPQITASAMKVYSQILVPTPGDIAEFATVFEVQERYPKEVFEAAMANLCVRSSAKSETIDCLEKLYPDDPVTLVRRVGTVGGKEGAELLGKYAETYAKKYAQDGSESAIAVVDEATKILGKWPTADAGTVLERLAVTLPEGKFRTRALRGSLRILRQMGMTPLEKRRMLSNALAMTDGKPEERARFAEMIPEFEKRFPERPLFNGKDFTGWEMLADVFRIEDGAIVGGNFETGVDRNQFLTTTERFGDFYLRLECKIIDAPGNARKDGNAGIQIRSERIPGNHEMIGYQADMTSDGSYWGHLYDESRRRRMLQTPDPELVRSIWKPNDWNRYEILCQGRNVRIFLNGVETVNYTETDETLAQTGLIGLQIHAGGPARAYYRNIFITTDATNDSRW